MFSSPEFVKGTGYYVYCGCTSTGTVTDGLYEDGTYTPGTKYADFTVAGTVTSLKNL